MKIIPFFIDLLNNFLNFTLFNIKIIDYLISILIIEFVFILIKSIANTK